MSALLGKNGFTSAEDILEGESGFFQAMKGAVDENVLNTLGETWLIERLAQKYHASCHATHSPIEATWAIFDKEGLSIADIKTITVFSSEVGLSAAHQTTASTGLEGPFCIQYCVANALLRGKGSTGLQAFSNEKVNDPEIKTVMNKISSILDPELTMMDARVEVETNGGKIFSAYSSILEEVPELDDKKSKIKDKFMDLCEPVLGRPKADDLVKAISHLEEVDNMSEVVRLI